MAIVAGISPVAYPGIEACWDLARWLPANITAGEVTVVPIADVGSFLDRSLDAADPNTDMTTPSAPRLIEPDRILPGCDIVIEVRGGALHESHAHYVAASSVPGSKIDVHALMSSSEADFRVATEHPPAGTPVIDSRRVPTLIVSAGGIDRHFENGASRILATLQSCLVQLGCAKEFTRWSRSTLDVGPRLWRHEVDGQHLWIPQVAAGQSVREGESLGYLSDEFGAHQGEVVAPFAGWVLAVALGLAVDGSARAQLDRPSFSRTVTLAEAAGTRRSSERLAQP